MNWLTSSVMWVMSFIPWWLYAISAVAIYFAIRIKLGEKLALVYAIAACAFVFMDVGGDAREAWVREAWKAQAQKAQEAARKIDTEAAEDTGADLQSQLDKERAARKELEDALARASAAGTCSGVDDVLERLWP